MKHRASCEFIRRCGGTGDNGYVATVMKSATSGSHFFFAERGARRQRRLGSLRSRPTAGSLTASSRHSGAISLEQRVEGRSEKIVRSCSGITRGSGSRWGVNSFTTRVDHRFSGKDTFGTYMYEYDNPADAT
jgi:hypothetical protein